MKRRNADRPGTRPTPRRGGMKLGLLALLVVVAGAIGMMLLSRRPAPAPIDMGGGGPRPSSGRTEAAEVVAQLDRWATEWTAYARSSPTLGRPDYAKADFARELAAVVRSRARSPLLRDSSRYDTSGPEPTLADLAAWPAIRALVAEGRRAGVSSIDGLDPRLLLCDLTPTDTFVPPDQGGVPESLARRVPTLPTGDRNASDMVLMRRRLRERLDDLARVADAAHRLPRPATGLDTAPTFAWAWSLDADRLAASRREPEPGSLPLFATADLIAAEVIVASWPPAREGAPPASFDPFAILPDNLATSLARLSARAEAESRELARAADQDAATFAPLLAALRELAQHEDDREARIVRGDWHATPP